MELQMSILRQIIFIAFGIQTLAANTLYGRKSSEVLPAGWKELRDANGDTYYVNQKIMATQWDHPGGVEGEERVQEDERPGLTLHATCDNNMTIFADTKLLINNNDWRKTSDVEIPENTNTIEIHCSDYGVVGGILASFNNGLKTDGTWSCSANGGSTWNHAYEIGLNGMSRWKVRPHISSGAKWIWTGKDTYRGKHKNVICKISLVCQKGWDTYGKNCYKIFQNIKSTQWYAHNICQGKSSNLISIENSEKDTYFKKILSKSSHTFWIGLNRVWEDRLIWMWMTGKKAHYKRLQEPVHNLFQNRSCVTISGLRWYWEIENCNDKKYFICEKAISKISSKSKQLLTEASSVYKDDRVTYGSNLAFDGNKNDGAYFRSKNENMPYIRVKTNLTAMSNVTITNTVQGQKQRIRTTEVRIGNSTLPPGFKGRIDINKFCGTFSGSVKSDGDYVIKCSSPIVGNVITIQIVENGNHTLIINEITINVSASPTVDIWKVVLMTISTTLFLGVIIFFFLFTMYIAKENKRIPKKMMKEALSGNESGINPNKSISNQIEILPVNRKYEIKENEFTIGHTIGDGQFGIVSVGTVRNLYGSGDTKVAIKQVKNHLDKDQLSTIIGELKIMSNLGVHLNLVNLVGACMSENTNKIYVLLEYCSRGDLKTFLLENKKMFIGNVKQFDGYIDTHFTPNLLLNWCYQVAKGMEYLEEKMVMHGDLAARNILISEDFTAKICDFGLSKHMYYQKVYKKRNRRMIPWAWMGLEYLQTGNFHMKSDVWSFGVLLWEIYTLGNKPYGIEPYEDVKKRLENGERLPIPEDMNELDGGKDLYSLIMKPCWEAEPDKRPNFKTLVQKLENVDSELSYKYQKRQTNFPNRSYMSKEEMLSENEGDNLLASNSNRDSQSIQKCSMGNESTKSVESVLSKEFKNKQSHGSREIIVSENEGDYLMTNNRNGNLPSTQKIKMGNEPIKTVESVWPNTFNKKQSSFPIKSHISREDKIFENEGHIDSKLEQNYQKSASSETRGEKEGYVVISQTKI